LTFGRETFTRRGRKRGRGSREKGETMMWGEERGGERKREVGAME